MENEVPGGNENEIAGDAPDGVAPQPPSAPAEKTVPLSALVQERRQAHGRIASLSARIQELEAKTASAQTTPPSQSDEEKLRAQWWDKLGIKDSLSKIEAMEKRLEQLQAKAELGERAHAQVTASANRAMTKVENIVKGSFDKDLESIGFDKDTWESFVASQMTDEDVQEFFADPNQAKALAEKCKKMMMPKINQNKSAIAAKVANLPRTPGPGGMPPAPPAPQPVKGKALHSRAFERLTGRMSAEG